MPLPLEPKVLDVEAIHRYATSLGLELPHQEQVQLLTSVASLDVQAAPGCGKTTLVALKLCIIASGWTSGRQGICVLTYTNTAKDQIRSILEKDRSGRRLLQYPHFIGTFQNFVDTFLSLPHLRAQEIDLRSIDDDYYARSALHSLESNGNAKLRGALGRRGNGQDLVTTATYRFGPGGLEVFSEAGQLPFGPDTASGLQFVALKHALGDRGIFRYSDMFALAHQYLARNASLTESLRWRFPMVIIDEMQDTRKIEEDLLNPVFDHEDCILQRVGDVNQRIFGIDQDLSPSAFPKATFISLPYTMRFGQSIAKCASALTIAQPQAIEGRHGSTELGPVLICFDETTITAVPHRFAQVVSDLVPRGDRTAHPIKVIGSRKKSDANQVPKSLTCYFPNFQKVGLSSTQPTNLFQAIAASQLALKEYGRTAEAVNLLWRIVCEILRINRVNIAGRLATQRSLIAYLQRLGDNELSSFKEKLSALLVLELKDQERCEEASSSLLGALEQLLQANLNAREFCSYNPEEYQVAAEEDSKGTTLTISTATGDILLEFDTIHNVKGETHSATLIVECFTKDRIHDLKEVLPKVVNRQDPKRAQMPSVKKAGLLTFVGMTRPKHLLCFAVLKEHVEHHLAFFTAAGWRVEDMTN